MANINFPINPTLGDKYFYNNLLWEWNGVGWVQLKENTLISDTTYSGVWVGGYTADAGTDTFTKVAHGLVNGDILDFRAGGGTLPTGVSAYDIDMIGGEYYQIINKTDNTFQIASGGGGIVAIDITTNGSNFEIRKGLASGVLLPITLPTLYGNNSINIDMIINEGKNVATTYLQILAVFFDSNNTNLNHIGLATKGYWNIQSKSGMVNKYLVSNHRIIINRLDTMRYMASNMFSCFNTDNKSTGAGVSIANIIQLQKTNILYDLSKFTIQHSTGYAIRDARVIITYS